MSQGIYIEAEHTAPTHGAPKDHRPRRLTGVFTARHVQRLRDKGWTIRTERADPQTQLQQRLEAAEARHDALIDTLVNRGQLPEADAAPLRRQPAESRETQP